MRADGTTTVEDAMAIVAEERARIEAAAAGIAERVALADLNGAARTIEGILLEISQGAGDLARSVRELHRHGTGLEAVRGRALELGALCVRMDLAVCRDIDELRWETVETRRAAGRRDGKGVRRCALA